MNGLAFCAGIGGLELGIKQCVSTYRTACYVERETHVTAVLAARMQEGSLCKAPIWSDLCAFDPKPWRGKVDIISAGYPCQPFSSAGKRKGAEDPRHLWPFIAKHINVIRPTIVFCENVSNHLTLGFEQVCEDLSRMGYSIEAGIFSAAEVGAQHLRKRLFFIAHASGSQFPAQSRRGCEKTGRQETLQFDWDGTNGTVANTNSLRKLQPCVQRQQELNGIDNSSQCNNAWPVEPNVGRVADGVSFRMDRLRALGNAVVPQTAALAFHTLTQKAFNE